MADEFTSPIAATVTIDGEGFSIDDVTDEYTGVLKRMLDTDDLPVAKIGELTTRTDSNTGTLTMETGHGITTAAKLDVYWLDDVDLGATAGSRRTVTVGTVSGNSVPIDLGAGDNLPPLNTAVTAMVPVATGLVADFTDVTAFGMSIIGISDASRCTVSLGAQGTAYVEGGSIILNGPDWGNTAAWANEKFGTTPLAAGSVDTLLVSHGDSANAGTFRLSLGLDV